MTHPRYRLNRDGGGWCIEVLRPGGDLEADGRVVKPQWKPIGYYAELKHAATHLLDRVAHEVPAGSEAADIVAAVKRAEVLVLAAVRELENRIVPYRAPGRPPSAREAPNTARDTS